MRVATGRADLALGVVMVIALLIGRTGRASAALLATAPGAVVTANLVTEFWAMRESQVGVLGLDAINAQRPGVGSYLLSGAGAILAVLITKAIGAAAGAVIRRGTALRTAHRDTES